MNVFEKFQNNIATFHQSNEANNKKSIDKTEILSSTKNMDLIVFETVDSTKALQIQLKFFF